MRVFWLAKLIRAKFLTSYFGLRNQSKLSIYAQKFPFSAVLGSFEKLNHAKFFKSLTREIKSKKFRKCFGSRNLISKILIRLKLTHNIWNMPNSVQPLLIIYTLFTKILTVIFHASSVTSTTIQFSSQTFDVWTWLEHDPYNTSCDWLVQDDVFHIRILLVPNVDLIKNKNT